ncbi:MAG: ABC-2 transporter permease [Gammaproteobacteria bacterium]
MNQMITLFRREIWEHRSILAVPTVFGGLFVVAAILGVFGLVKVTMGDGQFSDYTLSELAGQVQPHQWRPGMEVLFASVATTLQMIMGVVVFFYLIDALYTERRDRSILFWKSLPVTDAQVVASKFLTGAVVIPAVTVAVFLATCVVLWLIGGLTALVAGTGAALAAGPAAMLKIAAVMVYALLVQAVWYAPLYAWLLLASAYAKRAVLLWAVLPPVGLIIAEQILFGTERFAEFLGERIVGGFALAFDHMQHGVGWDVAGEGATGFPPLAEILTPGRFLAAPETWVGLALAFILLAGAVWLRRWRDEA